MINRRTRRPVARIETLRQESFNATKGINFNTSPVENSTVLESTNFEITPDGSLELRKPIEFLVSTKVPTYLGKGWRVQTVKRLYNTEYYIAILQNTDREYRGNPWRFGIYREDGTHCVEFIYFNDYYTGEEKKLTNTILDSNFAAQCAFLDFSEVHFCDTPTSTILTGVLLEVAKTPYKELKGLYDPELYDAPTKVYRTLQVTVDTRANTASIRIYQVYPNELTLAEGDLPLNINLALDNPYALRDKYDTSVPVVKGILAYAMLDSTVKHPITVPVDDSIWAATKVTDLTESAKRGRFTPLSAVEPSPNALVLKAFCNMPKDEDSRRVYCLWERSLDGVTFEPLPNPYDNLDRENINVIRTEYTAFNPDTTEDSTKLQYELRQCVRFTKPGGFSPSDLIMSRPDVLIFKDLDAAKVALRYTYRFRMFYVETREPPVTAAAEPAATTALYEDYIIGTAVFNFNVNGTTEALTWDKGSASAGKCLYYNSSLYTYSGKNFGTYVYVSDPGEVTRPLTRLIDLNSAVGYTVTALVPWRDYIIAATNKALYLISKSGTGFVTKTLNPAIGIPEEDARTVQPTLNGILFKSGAKMFMLYPNAYATTDTILNVLDMSIPIENYLAVDNLWNFAFSTESNYWLCIVGYRGSSDFTTQVLKYNYVAKTWIHLEYPLRFIMPDLVSLKDIRFVCWRGSNLASYKLITDLNALNDYLEQGHYGDLISYTDDENGPILEYKPIPYSLDSGQKTSNVALTKTFVESKIVVAVKDSNDTFPMEIDVAIEGDIRIHHICDESSGAFWKEGVPQIMALGGESYFEGAQTFNTFRQLLARYSGQGKSIRHLIHGKSLYAFKLYEVLYRYKYPNVKQ